MTNPIRPRNRSLLTAAAALALALPLAACGDTDDGEESAPAVTAGAPEEMTPPGDGTGAATDEPTTEDGSGGDATSEGSATGSADPNDVNTIVAQAIALAEDETGGTAFEVDLEEDGEWEVSVAVGGDEIDVIVSPDGSEVRGTDDGGTLDDDERAALDAATIGIAEAIATALDEVDGTFDDADLDEDHTPFAWEITIDQDGDDDIEVYVDVTTGDVLRVEND